MPLDPRMLTVALLVIPLAGAIACALCRRNVSAARSIALFTVLLNLAVTVGLAIHVTPGLIERNAVPAAGTPTFEPAFVTRFDLLPLATGIPGSGPQFFIGIDGLNLWLIALTSLLLVPSVLVSWNSITDRANEFYAWLLVLQTAMLGVFLSFDLILFYVFFELTLVPLFFLIGIWGGPMRREAARKFFLFTLTGSLIALLGLVGIVVACQYRTGELTFSVPRLVEIVQGELAVQDGPVAAFWHRVQMYAFIAMTAGFAVKVPLFPLHTWLPLAHTEAPTAGSVLLAGVLLKLGTYGFLRLAIPLAPDAALAIGTPVLGGLAAIGIIYGALCAFAQQDIKKLVAYSSVSHMGFCVLGLFALNTEGISGGLLQMINHGLSTGGLFLLVGMLYERYHTRMMPDYSGMGARLKLLSVFMVFICLTSIGFPGLNGFVGEMLILAGTYGIPAPPGAAWVLVSTVAAGIFLGAWYLFTMLRNVFFGPVHEPDHGGHAVSDLNGRELAAMLPLAAACIWLGVNPQPVLQSAARDVNVVVRIADAARLRAQTPTRP
ncbi:MAG: NuoM family protein [Gemmataceae bacterium]